MAFAHPSARCSLEALNEQLKILVRRVEEWLINEGLSLKKPRKEKAGLRDDLLTGRIRVTPPLEAKP
jgi:hypothetical protein